MNVKDKFEKDFTLEFYNPKARHSFDFEIKTLTNVRDLYPKGSNPPLARHNFFQLFHVTHGPGAYFVDFEQVILREGDTLFLRSGQVHGVGTDPELDGYLILFKPEFVEDSRKNILESPVFNHYLHSPLLRSPDAATPLTGIIEQIHQEYHAETNPRIEKILNNYLEILVLKAESSRIYDKNPDIDHRLYQGFSTFRKVVDQQFQITRNVKDIAYTMGTSTKRLNHLCKMFSQFTAKEFIDRRTILEIKRRLSTEDVTIKELSYSLGFEEPTNLVKYFKRHTGTTPRQFQQQV